VGFEHALFLQQTQNNLTLLVAADTVPSPFFFLVITLVFEFVDSKAD
jgi:hypothetical protein